jgi:hypothetical protein
VRGWRNNESRYNRQRIYDYEVTGMARPLGRREFIQATGATAAAVMMSNVQRAMAFTLGAPLPQDAGAASIDFDNENNDWNSIYAGAALLGRVHFGNRISIWNGPSPDSGRVRNVYGGSGPHGSYIAPIYKAVRGVPYDAKWHSDIWYETVDGYMHSGHLIPAHQIFNEPEESIGSGFWGEVTVPEAFQRRNPRFTSPRLDFDYYKLVWGQVHRVVDRADDDEGNAWYKIYDDWEPERPAWVLARNLRRITQEELAPISPDITDKRIVIDLGRQSIICYESGIEVFRTLIASGTTYQNDDGESFDFSTPEGAYHVQRKRPSRRMRGGFDKNLDYDVNGVPFCTYFSFSGAAVHGAFWHNNYGQPRSHGCINVVPDAAKWIYRWSQPYMGYDEDYRWVEPGEQATPIDIIV